MPKCGRGTGVKQIASCGKLEDQSNFPFFEKHIKELLRTTMV